MKCEAEGRNCPYLESLTKFRDGYVVVGASDESDDRKRRWAECLVEVSTEVLGDARGIDGCDEHFCPVLGAGLMLSINAEAERRFWARVQQ